MKSSGSIPDVGVRPKVPQDRRSIRLRRSLFALLLTQVLLSVSLFSVSVVSDNKLQSLNRLTTAASQQKLAFQDVGLSISRLLSEIKKDEPNQNILKQVQHRLFTRTVALKTALMTIQSAANQPRGFLSQQAEGARVRMNKLRPTIEVFLDDILMLSTALPDQTLFLRTHANKVALMISPNGAISQTIDKVIAEASLNAATTQQRLFYAKLIVSGLMITIVLGVGLKVFLPMTSDLSRAVINERELRKNIQLMALTDGLTGLLNRDGLEHAVKELSAKSGYAYVLLDLNLFKPINDTFGHAAGDAVLVELARRLKKLTPPGAYAARVGGDEFVLLDPSVTSIKRAVQRGLQLVDMFKAPVLFDHRTFNVSGAIGIALSTETDGSLDATATAADAAMYTRKGSGRSEFAIYTDDIEIKVPDLAFKARLEHAISKDEIVPWYQPKVDLISGEIVGFEALARWETPDGKNLPPSEFLDEVAEFGLQQHLTNSILKQVLTQMRLWETEGLQPVPIAINVPEGPLASDAGLQDILDQLEEVPDLAPKIVFEITEEVFLPRIANAVHSAVQRLSEKGVEISMDDFGTGYASFRHLHEFTFHEMKIDSNFVQGIGSDTSAEVILQAFMSIANGLGIRVVAEGIETEEQARHLIELGCPLGQGYLYSKPVPAEEVPNIMGAKPGHRRLAS